MSREPLDEILDGIRGETPKLSAARAARQRQTIADAIDTQQPPPPDIVFTVLDD